MICEKTKQMECLTCHAHHRSAHVPPPGSFLSLERCHFPAGLACSADGLFGQVMVQQFRCELLGKCLSSQSSNSIWVLKHFGGGRTIVDSSCAMSVVPFSGDGDPLEDRSFMPYANAFAETSRFKDVPRIIHIYVFCFFS